MDLEQLEAAFRATLQTPSTEELLSRFDWSFEQSGGDIHTAMASVNELLTEPISFEEFTARFRDAD